MPEHNGGRRNAKSTAPDARIAVATGVDPAFDSMIKTRLLLIIALLGLQAASQAGEFAKTLTPDNLRASGLTKLTPEELAQLEALVEAYKTGAVEKAVVAAPPPPTPSPAPAPAPNAVPEVRKGVLPDWVGALITLKRTENVPAKKQQALESRIAGNFDGWSGHTNFKLENGQIWTLANNEESYVWVPALKSPKVKIFPASFGTFWLEVEGVTQRVRIRPIRLE